MTAMIAVEPGALVAFFHRPTTSLLVIAVVVAVAGWAWHLRCTWATRPEHEPPTGDQRPRPVDGHGLEPPAVVALLTNGYDAPNTAVTATALDLAARGCIPLTTVDGELAVVNRANAGAGD